MHEKKIIRSWREIKVMMKWRFASLTDADFEFEGDNRDAMLDRVADKIKKTRSELEMLFAEIQTY